ncbi:MAG: hypothetical protein EBR34_15725 [Sphingomonadaceae bacterium]|nr:hypothetical protein [Sphingomonadaceae bacterium]
MSQLMGKVRLSLLTTLFTLLWLILLLMKTSKLLVLKQKLLSLLSYVYRLGLLTLKRAKFILVQVKVSQPKPVNPF